MASKRLPLGDPQQKCAQGQGLQRVLRIVFLCLLLDLLDGLVSNASTKGTSCDPEISPTTQTILAAL